MRARTPQQDPLEKTASPQAVSPHAPSAGAQHVLSPHRLAALQRTAGNSAVQRLVDEARNPHAAPGSDIPVQRSSVHQVLRAAGRPMDPATREDMEARLGADFSDVRLHTDTAAQRSAADVGARAYTSGNHIVIGRGGGDKHTLAHELTHVLQQRQGPVAGTETGDGLSVSSPSDRFELEAEANAVRVMSGRTGNEPSAVDTHHGATGVRGQRAHSPASRLSPSAGTVVQRTPEDDLTDDPKAFLSHSAVSMDFQKGMNERTRDLRRLDYAAFVNQMMNWERHWFVLVLDPRRNKEGKPAYYLTPAVEKYWQAFPDAAVFESVNPSELPQVLDDSAYLASSYVPYFNRGSGADHEATVGHTRVRRNARGQGARGSEFVFTATMNGCAFAVTGDAQDDHFTAWHYQSPGTTSNAPHASAFRQERSPTDWFDVTEYHSTGQQRLFEATNVLWQGPSGWEILSQENSVHPLDMSDAQIENFKSRALHLDGGHEVAYTKNIYTGLLKDQSDRFHRSWGRDTTVELEKNVRQPVMTALSQEMIGIGEAATFEALAKVARDCRNARITTVENVRRWLAEHQVGDKQRSNAEYALGAFANGSWLQGLETEATARAGGGA
ncbi:DUF4157 domain-containing protein [Streptomyces cadmiisoli]|uniref:eCIS core domain-containing protein n=1 Tax=Streptomyces cadmiisoli TaxID=2184053 RepID=UPI0026CC9696